MVIDQIRSETIEKIGDGTIHFSIVPTIRMVISPSPSDLWTCRQPATHTYVCGVALAQKCDIVTTLLTCCYNTHNTFTNS